MAKKLKVLVACEYSGRVRQAFRNLGHDAWSCDILDADDSSKNHIRGDVLSVLHDGWDLMIAHPPCTYLTNSGVCHLHKDATRWPKLFDAADFFAALFNAPIPRIAVENPIMHKYARKLTGAGRATQIVHPWMFGHTEQKATGLWLNGLMPLIETNNVKDAMLALPANQRQRLHYLPPSPDRWKIRSTTFQGIASAMADQWGGNIEENNK